MPWSLPLALERIPRPLIILHISAVGRRGLGNLKLKGSLPGGREGSTCPSPRLAVRGVLVGQLP